MGPGMETRGVTEEIERLKALVARRAETGAALEARVAELTEALQWLVNLGHDIGKAGEQPEEGEVESALEQGVAVLAAQQGPT